MVSNMLASVFVIHFATSTLFSWCPFLVAQKRLQPVINMYMFQCMTGDKNNFLKQQCSVL